MIHNRYKYFFLLFLSIIGISCNSFSNSESNLTDFSEKIIGDYYQKLKIPNSNGFFEKSSSHYRFLVIAKADSDRFIIKEIDISLYAYTNKFWSEVNSLFPRNSLSKFTLYEKVKYGKGVQKKNSPILEVNFTNFTTRESQSSNLLEGADKFVVRKIEAKQLFQEKISYSITPDDGLWRAEETLFPDRQEPIHWRNYQTGTVIHSYPYSEFSPNKNTLEYSRIYSFEDYSYKKIFKEIPTGIKLYTNKQFVIYYYLGDKFNPEDSDLLYFTKSNKQISLLKANLPLIIYKKENIKDEPTN